MSGESVESNTRRSSKRIRLGALFEGGSMAYRLDIKRILSMNFFHDLPQIMLGCALAAIATDLF